MEKVAFFSTAASVTRSVMFTAWILDEVCTLSSIIKNRHIALKTILSTAMIDVQSVRMFASLLKYNIKTCP